MHWIDLAPVWDKLKAEADRRLQSKRSFVAHRCCISQGHFYGLLAEYVYGELTGQQVNFDLRSEGDGGCDFPDTDVKGCTYWKDPWLKQPVDKPVRAKNYVLVGLDIENKKGYVVGYATDEELKKARVFNWGHGDQYAIRGRDLHPVATIVQSAERRTCTAEVGGSLPSRGSSAGMAELADAADLESAA